MPDNVLPPPHVIEEMMKHCRCCPCCRNPPCDGVMAGGLCDEFGCEDDEYRDDREEDHLGIEDDEI